MRPSLKWNKCNRGINNWNIELKESKLLQDEGIVNGRLQNNRNSRSEDSKQLNQVSCYKGHCIRPHCQNSFACEIVKWPIIRCSFRAPICFIRFCQQNHPLHGACGNGTCQIKDGEEWLEITLLWDQIFLWDLEYQFIFSCETFLIH